MEEFFTKDKKASPGKEKLGAQNGNIIKSNIIQQS